MSTHDEQTEPADEQAEHADAPATHADAPAEKEGHAETGRTLPGPNPEPEDAGSAQEARARLRRILGFGNLRSQLLVGGLCALLGFALVAQIQHTEASGLSTLSESELVRILDDVDDRNDRLEAEAAELAADEEELRSGSNQREAARQQAIERAEALSILAGTVPVTGPGVEMRIDGRAGSVSAANLVTLVQELRDAGAEAIDFNGTRIVVDSHFGEADQQLLLEGEPLAMPVTVIAIGDPDTLSTAMRIPGGVADTIEQRGGSFEVEPREQVDIDSVVEE